MGLLAWVRKHPHCGQNRAPRPIARLLLQCAPVLSVTPGACNLDGPVKNCACRLDKGLVGSSRWITGSHKGAWDAVCSSLGLRSASTVYTSMQRTEFRLRASVVRRSCVGYCHPGHRCIQVRDLPRFDAPLNVPPVTLRVWLRVGLCRLHTK